jgi:hypothetical protein
MEGYNPHLKKERKERKHHFPKPNDPNDDKVVLKSSDQSLRFVCLGQFEVTFMSTKSVTPDEKTSFGS